MAVNADDSTLRWMIEELISLKCEKAVQQEAKITDAWKKNFDNAYGIARYDSDKRVENKLGFAARKAAKEGKLELEQELRAIAKWIRKDDDTTESQPDSTSKEA